MSALPPAKSSFLGIYVRVLKLLGPERRLATTLAVANIVAAALQFVEPVIFGRVVDILTGRGGGEPGGALGGTLGTLGFWAVVGLGGIAMSILISWQSDRLAHRRRLASLSNFFEHVLTLPPAFHDATHSARLLKVMLTGTDHLWGIWLGFFRDHFASYFSLIVLLPLTLLLNWRMALLLIALILVFSVITWYVIHRTHTMQGQVEAYHSELATHTGDALGNIVLIQSYVRRFAEVKELEALTQRLLAAQFPVLGWWAVLTVLTRTAAMLCTLSMFALGAWLSTQGLATVGDIVTFMGFAGLLVGRLEQALGFVRSLFFMRPGLEEFFSVLDTTSSVADPPHGLDLGRARGRVTFEGVRFGYLANRPAIQELSIDVAPGTRVAVVGHSGSGKSTALALLMRLYDPESGRVLIDGHDLKTVKLDSLRRNLGVVFQNNSLFQRSVADNLRVGWAEATDAELAEAAKLAQAHDFIMGMPEGYATVLGERGARLSGGERQRLAIARAILKDPPILLMDEATSALDTQTEAKLQQALRTVMAGRTTFIIAHRLSTIRDVDLVLVMDRGLLVEQGSYEELVQLGGVFAGLVKAQLFTLEPEATNRAVAAAGPADAISAAAQIPNTTTTPSAAATTPPA